MEILGVLGIIVATIVFLTLRSGSGQARESRGCAVAGMTALFFVVAFLMLAAFISVPPLRDWMDGLIGPGQSGDAFGFGRLGLFLVFAGGISCLVSLAVVLVWSLALKARRRSGANESGSRRGL
jgi:hypothetical protein